MRNRASGLFLAVLLWLLSLTPLSACTPGTADTVPDTENHGPAAPSALISHQQLAPLIAGVQEFDLIPYTRIPLQSSQLEVSSTYRPAYDKANLVQPGVKGFWHVKVPKEETRPWVLVDMKTKQSVAVLGILARQDADQVMWYGYRAVLEASDDQQNWIVLARLGLPREMTKDEWVYFPLPNPQTYRYYRFSTHDWCFLSMARLAMYVPSGTLTPIPANEPRPLQIQGTIQFDLTPYVIIPLDSSQLEVSSILGPAYDKANLVKPKGFWHVKMPRPEERAWVLVDLGIKRAVPLLRVRPRGDFPNHLWHGYTADLEASDDKQNWSTIAVLGIRQADLTGDWVYFLTGNLQPYRYYCLSVWDRYFLSMARIELYKFREDVFR